MPGQTAAGGHVCNCAYGPADPRCCIARARRRELEEAHRLGREGKPLPPQGAPLSAPNWATETADRPPRMEER
ncbi:RING finger membrane protein [Mycolicibacterium canariasense]|uniref:RING finger membrane protein n=1 Tax=Mycolicibacterium canariasense TaxID=228230 RepID=A0A100WIW9_MYCCR|nr:hypothetical protein [Mycolicibacterium canariasense]MCV7208425.1 hypothetical protein [Mycolicibacterium canariasense]GAS98792.1 RING finger membrane protein [Mycolicibacterium canariasense]GAS98926.1 RING finger membrane protein [Mycolicibacterium canariasense]